MQTKPQKPRGGIGTKKSLSNSQVLEPNEIRDEVFRRLKSYDKLNLLEQFAMFMGKAQILEMGFKNLLSSLYDYDIEKIEKWTLGRTVRELKECGLRPDFIQLLESVVDYRNYIAHDLLVDDAMIRNFTGGDSGRLVIKHLQHGIYELEQVMFLHDWCEDHDAWSSASLEVAQKGA